MSAETLAILGIVSGVAGIIIGGLIKIWQGNREIHILANTNFQRMTRDLRYALVGMFVLIMASIVATYKAIARLREPPK